MKKISSLSLIITFLIWLIGGPANAMQRSGDINPQSPAWYSCESPIVNIPFRVYADSKLLTSAKPFALDDHIISASFFHWYTATSGQLSGPWLPLKGRASWTGSIDWWKTQIKQIMLANIDVLYVHLMPHSEAQRIYFFKALYEMRLDGYDVPKIAPFLDPIITWGSSVYDLSIEANREMIVDQYIRFFNQYYFANPDEFADDYLAVIDGRVVLDTWHLSVNFNNISSFHRSDMEGPLIANFGADHPVFSNGIYQVTTDSSDTFSFADEKVKQFQIHAYSSITDYNNIKSVQLKGGYWDQNIRDPGYCLKRDGGANYSNVWNSVPDPLTVNRVYIESWNEYDEGSGIYAANPTNTYIAPSNPSTDTWSRVNNPFEYIKTTYLGARNFRHSEINNKNSVILWHDFPTNMIIGQSMLCSVYIRNSGFDLWTSNNNYCFGQRLEDDTAFGPGRYYFNDEENEVDFYGGIFRGRPVKFDVQITAPDVSGVYVTHWGMLQEYVVWFGESITNTIYVDVPEPGISFILNLGFILAIYLKKR